MDEKIFTIFAGVNGAGKSTLYNSPILEREKLGVRINTDEIVKTFGDWKNEADQVKAGRMAIKLRKDCIEKGLSFNQETTLTGNSIIKLVDQVKEKGYKVHLLYVGVNSPEIAKERIAGRVKKGGHDIPSETVEKRYYESIENLKIILPKVDLAEIYDNSKFYALALAKREGVIELQIKDLPEWLKNITKELNKSKENTNEKKIEIIEKSKSEKEKPKREKRSRIRSKSKEKGR